MAFLRLSLATPMAVLASGALARSVCGAPNPAILSNPAIASLQEFALQAAEQKHYVSAYCRHQSEMVTHYHEAFL